MTVVFAMHKVHGRKK